MRLDYDSADTASKGNAQGSGMSARLVCHAHRTRRHLNPYVPVVPLLQGLKVELDQRRCAVSAEEEVLDLMDSLEDAGKGGAEGWKPALKERHAALCEEERRIRREMEMLVDV